MWKKSLLLITNAVLLLIVIFGVLILNSPSTPPQPPYFTETRNSEYIISKEDGVYYIPTALNNKKARIPVGDSEVELEQYVNKKVKLELEYATSVNNYSQYTKKTQCILDTCREIIPGKNIEYMTVDVLSVEEL